MLVNMYLQTIDWLKDSFTPKNFIHRHLVSRLSKCMSWRHECGICSLSIKCQCIPTSSPTTRQAYSQSFRTLFRSRRYQNQNNAWIRSPHLQTIDSEQASILWVTIRIRLSKTLFNILRSLLLCISSVFHRLYYIATYFVCLPLDCNSI